MDEQVQPNGKYVILAAVEGRLQPEPREHYHDHLFDVPAGVGRLEVRLRYHRKHRVQLFISLHGPDGFRGSAMNLTTYGDLETHLWISAEDASPGGIPGPVLPGRWRVQIDIDHLNEAAPYHLEVAGASGPPASVRPPEPAAAAPVLRPEPGWYHGELHCHSTESDGRFPVEPVIAAAQEAGLDFLALTEHFTTSQWRKLAVPPGRPLALLHSCEITSHHGHANLHGLSEWVDVYVDRPGWTMNQAAEQVHAQGGLFCVNHPYSGGCAWRDFGFDWSQADLMEIYHALEGINNPFHPLLWDQQLCAGRRIIGVGGTDSHHPYEGHHRLGQLQTWIEAPELSERGILKGLRRGNVFVSRGAQLRFTAQNAAGDQAAMGARLSSIGQPVLFRVEYQASQPLHLFVIKNGLLLDSRPVEDAGGGWGSWTFRDDTGVPGYVRVELHSRHEDAEFKWIEWRDHTTMQALGNPIWIT